MHMQNKNQTNALYIKEIYKIKTFNMQLQYKKCNGRQNIDNRREDSQVYWQIKTKPFFWLEVQMWGERKHASITECCVISHKYEDALLQ